MALTVNSVKYKPLAESPLAQTAIQPFNSGAMGLAFEVEYDVTSSVSLVGKDIYFNPALWLDPNTPLDTVIAPPLFGFKQNYPPLATSQLMGALPTPRSGQGVNFQADLNAKTGTNFVITFTFFHTFDLNDFVNDGNSPADRRFTFSNVNAAVELTNDIAAVYLEQRLLRAAFVVDDLAGGLDVHFEDSTFDSRFYEQGLNAATPGEYFDWTYSLERGGQIVDNFSDTEPTTVTFTVDTATVGTIDTKAHFLIYREDSPIENLGFLSDLEGAYYVSTVLQFGVAAITGGTLWTLVAGTIWEVSYTIDPAYLDLNGNYRMVIGVKDGTGAAFTLSNSFITPLVIVVDAPPTATTGTMTGTIEDYNDTYTGNCLQATLSERLRICTKVDKASYDAELLVNGANGDFDTNLNTVQITVVDFLSQTTIVNINTTAGDPDLSIQDNASFYEVCFNWRIPDELANSPINVTFIFTYNMIATGTLVEYQDVISYPFLINADKLEENKPVIDQLITDIDFYIGGNQIFEICDDETGLVEVRATVDASLNGFNLIALIKPDIQTAILQEQEDYDNNVLPQLDSDIITSVDVLFAAGTGSFFIDPTKLNRNQKYRVYAIAKQAVAPAADCPVITLDSIAEVTVTGLVGPDEVTTITCNFFVTNFGPSTVTAVAINTTVSGPSITGPNQNDAFVTDNGTYAYILTFLGGFRGTPATVQQIFDITLSNGCTYTGRLVFHAVSPILNSITQDVSNQNAD